MTENPYKLTPEEEAYIKNSWDTFLACEHEWKDEDKDSPFLKRCTKCGGAEGIRFPDDWLG